MSRVAVLFARHDSIYKTMPGLDVYDKERDARSWQGGCPVVAHPPCRGWGQLRHFAKPELGEMANGEWAVKMVRDNGGILEHPAGSALWGKCDMALPGEGRDFFGGWTLPVDQYWFGHKARKRTWLYITGTGADELPGYPLILGEAQYICGGSRCKRRPEISKAEREHTPPELAAWLVDAARRCDGWVV